MFNKRYNKLIWGRHNFPKNSLGRSVVIDFPAKEDGDRGRTITFAGDDGVILYLLKRIEALEDAAVKKK